MLRVRDYKAIKNSLLDTKGNEPPKMKHVQKGEAFVVCYREYLTDIVTSSSGSGSSNFNLQNFVLQPGNPGSFPWLSQIAANYQEYEFIGLIFEFNSLSAKAVVGSGNSGSLGDIIAATNYNVVAPNYTNKMQMLESEYSSDEKPTKSFFHPIECASSVSPVKRLYVRTGAVASGQDQRLYDLGNFQIASVGAQANNIVVGELWVSYEVKFYKPVLTGVTSGIDVMTDKFQLTNPITQSPLGTSAVRVPGSSIGGTIDPSGDFYTFPPNITEGQFLFVYSVTGSTIASPVSAPSITGSPGLTKVSMWSTSSGPDKSNTVVGPDPTGTARALVLAFTIVFGPNVTQPATVTFGGGIYPTGGVFGDLVVTEMDANISS